MCYVQRHTVNMKFIVLVANQHILFRTFFFVHHRLFILTSVVSVDKQLRIVKRVFLARVASRREKKQRSTGLYLMGLMRT